MGAELHYNFPDDLAIRQDRVPKFSPVGCEQKSYEPFLSLALRKLLLYLNSAMLLFVWWPETATPRLSLESYLIKKEAWPSAYTH